MNKEVLKYKIYDAIDWLISFSIYVSLAALVIYSVVKFIKWSWGC